MSESGSFCRPFGERVGFSNLRSTDIRPVSESAPKLARANVNRLAILVWFARLSATGTYSDRDTS
jgi:hypothetical protein